MGYFKPMRRKIGVLTLLMACVFMGGWMRSRNYYDGINLNPKSRYGIHSFNCGLLFICSPTLKQWPAVVWQSEGLTGGDWGLTRRELVLAFDPRKAVGNVVEYDWRFDSLGCHISSGVNVSVHRRHSTWPTEYRFFLLYLPYCFIVVPLTAISLWLLLSKPPNSNQTKIVEPIPVDGA